MIKVEVIEEFTLKDFDKIKIIKRKNLNTKGKLYVGDVFECNEDMAKYLTGSNVLGKTVVKVIEIELKIVENKENVIPLDEEKIEKVAKEIKKEIKPKKTNKKK